MYLFQCLQKLCNLEKGLWVYIKHLNITYPVSAKREAAQQVESTPVICDKVTWKYFFRCLPAAL